MTILNRIKYAIPFTILFVLFGVLWTELSSTRSFAYSKGISGEKMPSFSVPSLSGSGSVSSSQIKGRVALLNFWASWCSACQAEHAMLMKIKDTYHVPIYGVSFKDEPQDARAYLRQYGNPYVAVGSDPDGTTGVDFGIYATPETFVVNSNGEVVYKQVGVIDQETWDNTIYPLIKKLQS